MILAEAVCAHIPLGLKQLWYHQGQCLDVDQETSHRQVPLILSAQHFSSNELDKGTKKNTKLEQQADVF